MCVRLKFRPTTKMIATEIPRMKHSTPRTATRSLAHALATQAPHFSSFDDEPNPRRRRAQEWQQHYMFLADFAAQSGDRETAKTLTELAKQKGIEVAQGKRPSGRDLILKALESGLPPGNMEELCEDTGLPYVTAYDALMKLADVGLVAIGTCPPEANGKRGGKRTPQITFTLTH